MEGKRTFLQANSAHSPLFLLPLTPDANRYSHLESPALEGCARISWGAQRKRGRRLCRLGGNLLRTITLGWSYLSLRISKHWDNSFINPFTPSFIRQLLCGPQHGSSCLYFHGVAHTAPMGSWSFFNPESNVTLSVRRFLLLSLTSECPEHRRSLWRWWFWI